MLDSNSPGMQHNWVHFVFPSTMAIHVPKLAPKSVLRKLLDPHIRHTAFTNWNALALGKNLVPMYPMGHNTYGAVKG
mgnify:CR=1 FL=1